VGVAIISAGGLAALAALEGAAIEPANWPLAAMLPIVVLSGTGYALAQGAAQARLADQAAAAERLRQAREQALLESVGDLVTWHDRNGHVLRAGGPVTNRFGVAGEELQGRGFFSQVHVSDRPAFLKALNDASVSDEVASARFRIHVAGGDGGNARVIWAEMRARRATGDNEPGLVAVTRDISEEMRRSDELELARAEAARSEEAKEQFLATVSHELRTPLNAIIGFSEVLASEKGPPDPQRRKEYLQIVRDSGGHLLQVVNTLLDISKIKAGHFDVLPEPFEIGGFTHGCCDLMALKAERAGVTLARKISTNLPELVADRRACKQILINLVSNAIKFTPPGGRVTVAAERQGDRILFVVSDTGIGIDGQDLPKLGVPFFQARSSYDRRYEGTGLGLSVVRGLVGLHRGSMTIESAPGEGTAVTVNLPIDCRGGPTQRTAPIHIHTLARAAADARALKTG
jgi:cell cycle sensor histidine kinase DivJ